MPYGLFHAFSYQSVSGQTETVELLRRNYAGPVVPLKALQGVRPLEWEAGVSSADKDEILQGTEVTLRLQNLDGFGIKTFLSEHPREWMVRRLLNGQLEFEGFLAQHLQTEPFRKNQEFELRATDGLGGLDAEPHTDEAGAGLETPVTFRRAIQLALSKTGLSLALWIASELHTPGDDPARCNLDQHFYHPGQFTGDGDVPDSCQVVLTEISRAFGLVIRQREGHWEAVEPNLEGGTVKFFTFAPDGRETGPVTVSRLVSVQGAETYPEGTARAEKTLFVFDDQQIGYTQPVKSVTLRLDYGRLINRLYNARFKLTDPTVRGGKALRGWYYYSTAQTQVNTPLLPVALDSFVSLDADQASESFFAPKLLTLRGLATDRGFGQRSGQPGLQYQALGNEPRYFVSPPVVVGYDQKVTLKGSFRQKWARGARVQLIAEPCSDAAAARLRLDPTTPYTVADVGGPMTLHCNQSGEWAIPSGSFPYTFLTYENTDEVRVGDKLVRRARPDWQSFTLETKPLSKGRDLAQALSTRYWAVRLVLLRAWGYDETGEAIGNNTPEITFRGLEIGYTDGLNSTDTKGEKFVVEAPQGAGGEVRGEETVKLGDCRNPNYYATIYERDGVTPTREWFRLSNPSFKAPLLHHVAHATLSRYRAPLQHIRGGVDSARLRTGDGVRVAWPEFTGVRFLCLGTQSSARQDEHQAVLRQLPPCVDAAHTGRHYDLLQDRESLVATREGGKCYAPATGIRFTDVRQNGRYGTTTGGGFTFPVYAVTLDWLDSFNRPPYKLTIRQVGAAAGIDFTVNALTHTLNLIPSEYEATVENQQGKRAQVKFTVAFIEAKVGTISLVGNTLTVPVENIPGGRQTVVSAKSIKTGGTLYEQTLAPPPGSDVDTEFAVTLPPDFGTDDVEVTISTPEGESRARQSVEVPEPATTRRYADRYADRYA